MTPSGIKGKIRYILRLDEPADRLAAAFALGVFISFTPTIGFHTAMVLLAAWALRFNKAVALTGTFVNNPWTIIPVYIGPTWLANRFMLAIGADVPAFNFDEISSRFSLVMDSHKFYQAEFWTLLGDLFRPYMLQFIFGTTVAGLVAAVIAYPVMLGMIKSYRYEKEKIRKAIKEKKAQGAGDAETGGPAK